MSPADLISAARALAVPFRPSADVESACVAAALVTASGELHTGVCIDAQCGVGFCAEHSAVAEMLKARESQIVMIVAVNEDGELLSPCGRCRELLWQLDERNLETLVILSADESAKLSELLPHRGRRH
jgi:cytidine deaminase